MSRFQGGLNPAGRLPSQPNWTFSPCTLPISNLGRELEDSNDSQEPGNEPGEERPSQSWGGSGRTAVPRREQARLVSHVQDEDLPPHLALLPCECCRAPRWALPSPGATKLGNNVLFPGGQGRETSSQIEITCKARRSKAAQKETWDARHCF